MIRASFIVAALLFSITASTGRANYFEKVEDWIVSVFPGYPDSCHATRIYDDLSVVKFGFFSFFASIETVGLQVGNQNWHSLEAGKIYPVTVQFDDYEPWQFDATGELNVVPNLAMTLFADEADELVVQFGKAKFMIIRYSGEVIMKASLRGSLMAMDGISRCRAADPFR